MMAKSERVEKKDEPTNPLEFFHETRWNGYVTRKQLRDVLLLHANAHKARFHTPWYRKLWRWVAGG